MILSTIKLIYFTFLKVVRAITPDSLSPSKRPLILYFDSLNPLEKNLASLIRKYLEMEFADKKPAIFKQITGQSSVIFPSNNVTDGNEVQISNSS